MGSRLTLMRVTGRHRLRLCIIRDGWGWSRGRFMLCITRNIESFATLRGVAKGHWAGGCGKLRVAMYTQIQWNSYIRGWSPMTRSGVVESKQEGNEWLV